MNKEITKPKISYTKILDYDLPNQILDEIKDFAPEFVNSGAIKYKLKLQGITIDAFLPSYAVILGIFNWCKNHGSLSFNEINTLPGFTSISMYPKLWQASGLAYPDLLDELIRIAMVHQNCRKHLVTNYL